MAHQAKNYDKAIIVGHSRLTPNKDFAHFIVPRTDNGEELVKQIFFAKNHCHPINRKGESEHEVQMTRKNTG